MNKPDTEGGFVLLEAIAALAIASLAATALIAGLIATSGRSAEDDVRSTALREAQVLLAETIHAADPADLVPKGDLKAARLSWRRTFEEADKDFLGLQKVTIEVDWQSAHRQGTTRLEAYLPAKD